MGTPKISVVVPVHNSRDTLQRTFRSVFEQTLPATEIEIIAVDDGSTDGGGEDLDRLAEEHPRFVVIHQDASGGPGRPRNAGLERATGEYVFFLDADDHLGPEALERCCAMADANGTDVVVPKYVGVGRKVNPYLFRRNVEFTTIYEPDPNLYGSITVLKLYRRSLLERHHLRFPEGVLSGEDQLFAVTAYFKARGVSVLADYDCYYWVAREDGDSALQRGGAPAREYYPEVRRLMSFVGEHTAPGQVRDRLMRRHLAYEVYSRFDPRYLGFSERERAETREAARELAETWGNPEIRAWLTPYLRLIDHCLRNGPEKLIDEAARAHAEGPPPIVVEGERAFAAYPGFRDEALGVPDPVYQVNGPLRWRVGLTGLEWGDDRLMVRGHAFAERVDRAGQSGELVLREREGELEFRVPFQPVEDDGGGERDARAAEIDFGTVAGGAPLPPGRWDVFAVARVQDLVHEERLVAAEEVEPAGPRITVVRRGSPLVTPYLTKGRRALTLHVGGPRGQTALAEPREVTVLPSGAVRVATELVAALPEGSPISVRALARHRKTKEVRASAMAVERRPGRLRVAGEPNLNGARPGKWDLSYEVTVGEASGEFRAAAPAADLVARRGVQPFRTVRGNLSLEVRGGMVIRLRRRLLGGR